MTRHTITQLPCGWAVTAPDGRIVSRHHPTRDVAETACRIFNEEYGE